MSEEKELTTDQVDTIEDLLEERKIKNDRRFVSEHDNDFDPSNDRRSGADRRDEDDPVSEA